MKIQTEEGIAESLPLSDIQQNTFWVKVLVYVVAILTLLGWSFFIYLLWVTMYIIENDVINNVVAKCVC